MDENAIWSAIDDQRLRLTDLLDQLSDEEWQTPSLCPGWTVRDVAAHLTMAQAGIGEILMMMIKIRGDGDHKILESARQRTWPTPKIIASIRGMVGSRRHIPVVTCRETLIDILVHSQDIAVPLDRRLDLPVDAAAEAGSRCWSTTYFRPLERLQGFRLVATDTDWTVGDGLEVRAPIDALLLILTGRLVALPRVTGPGADALSGRLANAAS
ncbi:MAG TPA: maleylpyruvate isomerase family mycothiol-dependent enzyme [Microlunatus sp.]